MAKHSITELDAGQLELMWNFLKLNPRNTCTKNDVRDLKQNLDKIRQAMIQKTSGQRSDDPTEYTDFNDLGTYINLAIVSALWLYTHGGLDILENVLGEDEEVNKNDRN